jgi:putative transposase
MFASAGVARFVYNWVLDMQESNHSKGGKFINDGSLRKLLTVLKKGKELSWLNNYSNNIAKQAVKDACDAYVKFFNKISSKPKFKSKRKSKPSFYQDNHKIKFTESRVRFEKIGWVRLSEKGRISSDTKVYNPRITHDGLHWYLTVGVDVEENEVELTGKSIGIDLGIKDLAIVSGIDEPFKNINKSKRVKSKEKKLRRLQRKVSRKYLKNKKGGSYVKTSNIIKLEKKILKVCRRLDNIRTDYIHKVTTTIVKTKPSRIVMENLNVKGMMKNKHLSKSVAAQRFYEFRKFVEYKSKIFRIEFIEADRWYPSSKMCSKCGYIKTNLSLSERTFECESCGNTIDRDRNAEINLSRYIVS